MRSRPLRSRAAITVLAPGAGVGINHAVYKKLGQHVHFAVEVVGHSRAPYDRYPESWPQGSPTPNLETFAGEVLAKGVLDRSDCLIVGSRGGQVVLPCLWQAQGAKVPPAVVINGGCAMRLPPGVPPPGARWPEGAMTFLLLGGQDGFRGGRPADEYVDDTRGRVPAGNQTTAILYVDEMQHMPQSGLLWAALPRMLCALMRWRSQGSAPLEEFRLILAALTQGGWSGRLLYTSGAGVWQDAAFGGFGAGAAGAAAALGGA